MNFPTGKYQIIYADPAWKYDDKAKAGNRGAESKYDVMELDEICKLPVSDIADEDCVLFLWGTWPQLPSTLRVIHEWGFEYKTVGFVWEKLNNNVNTTFMGMGNWTRANTEFCLIGTKGKPKRIRADISQLIRYPILTHSKKPDIVRMRIVDLCGDLPRIELFARTKVSGWDTWGNDEKLQLEPLEVFAQ